MNPIIIEHTFETTPEKIWQALTVSEIMKQWYFDLPNFKAEVDYEFQFLGGKDPANPYTHLCKIVEVIVNKKLKHTWRYQGYEGNTFVIWELFSEGNQTHVKLTHEGLETFPINNPDFAKQNFVEGWTAIVGTSLKNFLEKK